MAATTLELDETQAATTRDETTERDETAGMKLGLVGWLMLVPFVFFAVHGIFSFQMDSHADAITSRAMATAPVARNLGLLGYAVLPGLAYSVVMWMLLFNFRGVLRMAMERKALTILALMTVASAAWSQDPMKSVLNGGFYVLGTLFAYYLVVRFTPEELMTIVMRTGVAVCLLSAVMIFAFPRHGIANSEARTMGAWVGIFGDRVGAAKCSVYLMSPALIFGLGRKRWKNVMYVAVLLVFIVMAKAVSALGVTFGLVAAMALMQISRRLERNIALLLSAAVVIFCVAFAVFGVPILAQVLGMFGRDMTLTGRTEIWSILMESIMKRPLLGYGFYAFWQGLTGESANVIMEAHWFFGYAHNGFLEIVLQLGLVGASIFLFTFVNACKDAWYCIKYGRTAGIEWYCGLLVLAVLYNIDEETVLWPNDLLSILYVVACCGLAVEARRIRQERALARSAEKTIESRQWGGVAAA